MNNNTIHLRSLTYFSLIGQKVIIHRNDKCLFPNWQQVFGHIIKYLYNIYINLPPLGIIWDSFGRDSFISLCNVSSLLQALASASKLQVQGCQKVKLHLHGPILEREILSSQSVHSQTVIFYGFIYILLYILQAG